MANFNNQFATQKLREEATEPETWPDRVPGNNGIIWKKEKQGSRGANYVPYYKGHNIDTGGYTFGSVDKLKSFIDDYVLSNQLYNKLKFEPEKSLDEESVTGTGATFTPGTGEQTAPRATKKVKKEGKNIPSDWTDAKSIPNRPTKGGFIYKQLFEELSKFVKENKLSIKDIRSFNYYISKVREAIRQMRDENSEELYNTLESLRSQSDLMSAINILDDLKVKIKNHPKVDRITKIDALKAIDDIKSEYEPEEQDDDEDSYDWFTNTYEKGSGELEELDINDPILMAMRAKKDAPKPQASKPNPNQAKINMLLKKRAEIERDMEQEAEPEGGEIADKYGDMLNKIDSAIAKLKGQGKWGPETDPYMSQGEIERRARMIREGYAQFKNETKTRSKPDQFHQAIREVKKKVQQINKMYEYVSRLKTELSEGEDGLKYKMHTEKALNKIKDMVSELNYKIKRFK
jgi:hypothetical protein